jgi:hypothetical protein
MSSHALGTLVEVEASSSNYDTHPVLSAPQKAFPKHYHSVPIPNDSQSFPSDERPNGIPNHATTISESSVATPADTQISYQVDLEMSRPATPVEEGPGTAEAMQSFSIPPMNRYRMTAVCLLNLTNGLNDSAPGALIPSIEK